MSAGAHGSQKHLLSAAAKVTGGGEPPSVGAGNQTWVLCKITMISSSLSCLSSP